MRFDLPRLQLLPFLLLALSASGLADTQGSLRLGIGAGYDSNARRDIVVQDSTQGGVEAQPDAVFSAVGSAEGRYRGESVRAGGDYDVGVRQFVRLRTENLVIQSASGESSVALGRHTELGLTLRGKDRRGGDRDYTNLLAEAFVELRPDPSVELRLRGGANRFVYWNQQGYSFGGPEFGLNVRYRFDKRHCAFLFGDLGSRGYNMALVPRPDDPTVGPAGKRQDSVLSGGAGYGYRGPATLTLVYSYTEQNSNSYGEAVVRHRLAATGGVRLPWRLALLGQLVLQLSHFPEGLHLAKELRILEDDDAHSSATLKLVRPIAEHFDVEARYALYFDQFPQNHLAYLRQVAWLGLTWRL